MTAETLDIPNVQIIFTLELKDEESVPSQYAEFDGDLTFYFPGARVISTIDKDLRVISMSGQTKALDLFRLDDTIQIIGTWLNDDEGNYDDRSSLDRVHMLYLLCSIVEVVGWMKWTGGDCTEILKVIPQTLRCDNSGGDADQIPYQFTFMVVDADSGETSPYKS